MPILSGARIRELERKEKQLAYILNQQDQQLFVEAFKTNLAVLASLTPFSKWPKEFQIACDNARRRFPSSFLAYEQQHQ